MRTNSSFKLLGFAFTCLAFFSVNAPMLCSAGEYLVADRLLGRVLRYSEGGTYVGTLIDGTSTFGYGAASQTSAGGGLSGITLSPDNSRIYLTDRNQSRVVVYSYQGGSASELFQITSNGGSTVNGPATVVFSQDASKIYVSNIGPFTPLPSGDTVAQLTPNGASAGADLSGGPQHGRSGMALGPDGNPLVADLNLYLPGGGTILKYNPGANQFQTFIAANDALTGAAALLVDGNSLYVASLGGSNVSKYDATTGALQAGFGAGGMIPPSFTFVAPGALSKTPAAGSYLVGVLGFNSGDSDIQRFDSSGSLSPSPFATNTTSANFPGPQGVFDQPVANAFGFSEPTGVVYSAIPEPASAVLVLLGMVGLSLLLRRRAG